MCKKNKKISNNLTVVFFYCYISINNSFWVDYERKGVFSGSSQSIIANSV